MLPGESKQDNLQKNGRKSVREIEKKQKCLENINDENNVRGMSWSTKIGIATLEMKSKDLQQQKKELKMITYNCSINLLQQNLVCAELRANQHCPVYNSNNELWQNVIELENRLKGLEEKLVTCGEASPESTKSSSKRSMVSTLLSSESDTPAKKKLIIKINDNVPPSPLKDNNDNYSQLSNNIASNDK